MLAIRRDRDIYAKHGGWFHARWHFSFDEYYDAERLGVGALRVFNDDRLSPGAVWPMHPHRDIESLTYVVQGRFGHADSLGNGGELAAGGAQVMDFGHGGAQHSERNASATEPLRFIQFWIIPSDPGLVCKVQQHQFGREERTDQWLQIMGPAGEHGLDLSQDARVAVARLRPDRRLTYHLPPGRGAYLYLIDGAGRFDSSSVASRDAAELTGPHELAVHATIDSELILVDIPMRYRAVGVWAGR